MKTEYQKCIDGEFFTADPEMLQIIYRCKRLVRELNDTDMENIPRRHHLLSELFGSMGDNVHVDIDFHCEYGINIHCGNDVIINMNCTFVDNNRIDIGNNVLIASDVKIYTATHTTDVVGRTNSQENKKISGCFCRTFSRPVRIEDNVWIGGGAILLPGVVIGRNSVIGAGSVVTRSIPENCVAVGNPCRVIKHITNE
ncbi:MAG: sugar O-acetyltransferase [Bacteroidales bacterium]|nr:sugar O-acetyltransferase [Bacteroidales bacterium]